MQESTTVDEKQMLELKENQLTLEQKLNYCEEWKKSGLSRANFCKSKNISMISFKYWYYRFYFKRNKSKNENQESQWSPVIAKCKEQNPIHSILEFEFVLSDKVIVRTSLLRSDAVEFIQELSHAIAIVR